MSKSYLLSADYLRELAALVRWWRAHRGDLDLPRRDKRALVPHQMGRFELIEDLTPGGTAQAYRLLPDGLDDDGNPQWQHAEPRTEFRLVDALGTTSGTGRSSDASDDEIDGTVVEAYKAHDHGWWEIVASQSASRAPVQLEGHEFINYGTQLSGDIEDGNAGSLYLDPSTQYNGDLQAAGIEIIDATSYLDPCFRITKPGLYDVSLEVEAAPGSSSYWPSDFGIATEATATTTVDGHAHSYDKAWRDYAVLLTGQFLNGRPLDEFPLSSQIISASANAWNFSNLASYARHTARTLVNITPSIIEGEYNEYTVWLRIEAPNYGSPVTTYTGRCDCECRVILERVGDAVSTYG